MRVLLILLTSLLAACGPDETISGYAGTDTVWTLQELDGNPFPHRATLSFPEEGRVSGQAPCNRYFGAQTAPYPWFKAEGLGSTKMACPALAQEQAFFDALSAMTLAEVSGPVLILSNDAGREMVFAASVQ